MFKIKEDSDESPGLSELTLLNIKDEGGANTTRCVSSFEVKVGG